MSTDLHILWILWFHWESYGFSRIPKGSKCCCVSSQNVVFCAWHGDRRSISLCMSRDWPNHYAYNWRLIHHFTKWKSSLYLCSCLWVSQSRTLVPIGQHQQTTASRLMNFGALFRHSNGLIQWGRIMKINRVPSGKLTVRYGKWPFIVSFPIKHGDFHWLC